MPVAIELHEPAARRTVLVADDRAPSLDANGRIDSVEVVAESLNAPRVERDDLRALEPRAKPRERARVHGVDDDTIRACAPP